MTPSPSVTIGPSPLRILGKILIVSVATTAFAAAFVVIFGLLGHVWLVLHAEGVVAWTAAACGCFCVIAVLGALILRRPRIEIGPDGFVDQGIAGCRSRRWGDIQGGFVVTRFYLQSVVAYRLTDAFKESAKFKPTLSLPGNDEAILISPELAIGAAELAEILNQWKQVGRGPGR